jgi:geranyl-CoA carboxylase beta subunit
MAEDDRDAIRLCRELVEAVVEPVGRVARAFQPPRFSPDDIVSAVPVDYRQSYDVREVIARIADGSDFLDFKPGYGIATVCGHARIEGIGIGIIANNGPIDSGGATKAAQFIQLCCQSGKPLLFLQNTTGFMVGTEAEASGIVKHGSKLIQAVTNAGVPKITLQIGGAFGAGAYAMCGRAFGPRFIFSWPNNRLSVMGGEQAAKVLAIVSEEGARARGAAPDRTAIDATSARIVEAYDQQSRALFATARLWDDGIIDPRDTRRVLAMCLATVVEAEQRTLNPNSFGIARF